MAKLKLYRCNWPDPDTGDECGEITRGRQQTEYHRNGHKRLAPKTAKVQVPTVRRVYHVPSGEAPRLLEGEPQ